MEHTVTVTEGPSKDANDQLPQNQKPIHAFIILRRCKSGHFIFVLQYYFLQYRQTLILSDLGNIFKAS